MEVTDVVTHAEGRYVILNYKIGQELYTLVNVYAPNQESPQFWLEVFKCLEQFEGKRIIVGDFNVALDNNLDRSNPKSKNNDLS